MNSICPKFFFNMLLALYTRFTLISQFGSEEGYWQHEFEVYKINLPIEKYLESLKQEYLKNSISTQSNNQEAEETIENYNRYIEEVQSELVKQEQYEIFG